ncbi:MAG: ester cyclase [Chloroflexi bacterium]|nr:ester cyclase [Chloroflexota bacterium]
MNEQQTAALSPQQQAMLEVFGAHMQAELVTQSVDDALATMTDTPHVNHIPVMTGGVGREGVRAFYTNHLIGQFLPPDTETTTISRTIGTDQIVEESVASFTHTMQMDWMLPGIPPTGKRIEIAVVVIIRFQDGKIAHEHIYWDQASVLVQLGLIDASSLPVAGAESARKLLDHLLPSNTLIERAKLA